MLCQIQSVVLICVLVYYNTCKCPIGISQTVQVHHLHKYNTFSIKFHGKNIFINKRTTIFFDVPETDEKQQHYDTLILQKLLNDLENFSVIQMYIWSFVIEKLLCKKGSESSSQLSHLLALILYFQLQKDCCTTRVPKQNRFVPYDNHLSNPLHLGLTHNDQVT